MSQSRNTDKKQIQSLERKRAALLAQHNNLIKGRQSLLLRQAILTAWCEALAILQQQQGLSRTLAPAASDPDVHNHFQKLLNEEIALLGELTFSEQLSSCSMGEGTALPDPGPDTLSPGVSVWGGGSRSLILLRRCKLCHEPPQYPHPPSQLS
jgi:hypothetical protein